VHGCFQDASESSATVHSGGMHESTRPQVVGGYRLGRRVGEGRFLGHAIAPAVVDVVFLDELSVDEQRAVCAEANDFSSLADGGRVAILPRASAPSTFDSGALEAPLRLATPPDLRESWRHMEEATARAAQAHTADVSPEPLLARVSGILKRARRGPLMLAVLVGIVAVIAVVFLMPSTDKSAVVSSPAELVGVSSANAVSLPPTTSVAEDATPTAPPLTPSSTLGDFILVHVPARNAGGTSDVAVLERDGDTWIVRETYPDTPNAGNEAN